MRLGVLAILPFCRLVGFAKRDADGTNSLEDAVADTEQGEEPQNRQEEQEEASALRIQFPAKLLERGEAQRDFRIPSHKPKDHQSEQKGQDISDESKHDTFSFKGVICLWMPPCIIKPRSV